MRVNFCDGNSQKIIFKENIKIVSILINSLFRLQIYLAIYFFLGRNLIHVFRKGVSTHKTCIISVHHVYFTSLQRLNDVYHQNHRQAGHKDTQSAGVKEMGEKLGCK